MQFVSDIVDKHPITALHTSLSLGISLLAIVTPLPLLFQPFIASPSILLYAIVPSTYASATIERTLKERDCIDKASDSNNILNRDQSDSMPGAFFNNDATRTQQFVAQFTNLTYARVYSFVIASTALSMYFSQSAPSSHHSYRYHAFKSSQRNSNQYNPSSQVPSQSSEIVQGFLVVDTSLRLISALVDDTPIRIGSLRIHPLLFSVCYAAVCGCFVRMSVIGVGAIWVFGIQRKRGGRAIEYLKLCIEASFGVCKSISSKLMLEMKGGSGGSSWSDILINPLLAMFPMFD